MAVLACYGENIAVIVLRTARPKGRMRGRSVEPVNMETCRFQLHRTMVSITDRGKDPLTNKPLRVGQVSSIMFPASVSLDVPMSMLPGPSHEQVQAGVGDGSSTRVPEYRSLTGLDGDYLMRGFDL